MLSCCEANPASNGPVHETGLNEVCDPTDCCCTCGCRRGPMIMAAMCRPRSGGTCRRCSLRPGNCRRSGHPSQKPGHQAAQQGTISTHHSEGTSSCSAMIREAGSPTVVSATSPSSEAGHGLPLQGGGAGEVPPPPAAGAAPPGGGGGQPAPVGGPPVQGGPPANTAVEPSAHTHCACTSADSSSGRSSTRSRRLTGRLLVVMRWLGSRGAIISRGLGQSSSAYYYISTIIYARYREPRLRNDDVILNLGRARSSPFLDL